MACSPHSVPILWNEASSAHELFLCSAETGPKIYLATTVWYVWACFVLEWLYTYSLVPISKTPAERVRARLKLMLDNTAGTAHCNSVSTLDTGHLYLASFPGHRQLFVAL